MQLHGTIEPQPASLYQIVHQIVPAEYTADLVVLLLQGRPVHG